MKLNKAYSIFESNNSLMFNNIVSKPYADLMIKYEPETVYRIRKHDSAVSVLEKRYTTDWTYEFVATKEIQREDLHNDENYIFVDNEIVYSGVVATNIPSKNAMDKISAFVSDPEFDFADLITCKSAEEYAEVSRWLEYDYSFHITEAVVVREENKILKDLRLQQINIPYISHTEIGDMVFVEFKLNDDTIITGERLRQFRKIANKAISALFNKVFNTRAVSFRIFSTNEPYKTPAVVQDNKKYMH